jgi:mRNA-degrading endonuclease RelE of RelBE toxin-antitoxin system
VTEPLRPNPVAEYRLRAGKLRVYYDVEETPRPLVIVKAVGIKIRERVYVGGREIEL